jgi:hypothetical protein
MSGCTKRQCERALAAPTRRTLAVPLLQPHHSARPTAACIGSGSLQGGRLGAERSQRGARRHGAHQAMRKPAMKASPAPVASFTAPAGSSCTGHHDRQPDRTARYAIAAVTLDWSPRASDTVRCEPLSVAASTRTPRRPTVGPRPPRGPRRGRRSRRPAPRPGRRTTRPTACRWPRALPGSRPPAPLPAGPAITPTASPHALR